MLITQKCRWFSGQFLTLCIVSQVLGLVEIFRARIVDVAEESLTIEVAALSALLVRRSSCHFRVLQNGFLSVLKQGRCL